MHSLGVRNVVTGFSAFNAGRSSAAPRRIAIVLLLLLATRPVHAQTQEAFEVFSLKPSAPNTRFDNSLTPSQFTATGITALQLLISAYPEGEVQPWTVANAPDWFTTERWDLVAKLPPNMPAEEQSLYRRTEGMLRKLMAEEFKLQTHRESRETPVYALAIAKGGSKLKSSTVNEYKGNITRTRFEFQHQSIPELALSLYRGPQAVVPIADRPVIDQTGLTGFYDFTLEWTNDTPDLASIYTAIEQQLGLGLQPQKAAMHYLVIDKAEKPVQAN